MSRTFFAFCFLLLPLSLLAQAKEEKPNFPTTEEIQLAVSQAERAFYQYKFSVDDEATMSSAHENDLGVKKDRENIKAANQLIAALKKNPDGFHGIGGFLLLTTLDDASRNAALCSGFGIGEVFGNPTEKFDKTKAYAWAHVAESCQAVSAQLYTVSENVNALVVRELEGQQILNHEMNATLDKCANLVKSMTSKKSGVKK
jgi:hypothetical protein